MIWDITQSCLYGNLRLGLLLHVFSLLLYDMLNDYNY